MRQCTATADVQMAPFLFAILAGQARLKSEDFDTYAPDATRCELGLWHEGEHAGFVWDWEHKPQEALWARWTADGAMRFESLAHCEIEGGPDGDACTLYRDHPRDHSWNVVDPEMEAFRRRVLAENAGMLAWLTRKRN
ncbi:hypothetical protein [Streptomyces caeruleatus]|uniref:Uncharacterized protein n=1 Tax=Streptomyces caeruleatus TaxID=661399 RepID=A0A101TKK9_9ACTN|nr:hypothetical protein [Streptomyces caeruleatus]KUN94037.1 hypothetical protein AQJ67_37370 [Streptomyces caeruleatus]